MLNEDHLARHGRSERLEKVMLVRTLDRLPEDDSLESHEAAAAHLCTTSASVPEPTTRPLSRRYTMSHCSTVDNRWAMITKVLAP